MLTDAHIAANLSLAGGLDMLGTDAAWQGVGSCDRPPSKYPVKGTCVTGFRDKVRTWYANRQGGICPQCGTALGDRVEFCHIVARGPKVKGFVSGNLFIGHKECNSSTAPEFVNGVLTKGIPVLWTEHLARPDLVVMDKPTWIEIARQHI